MLDYNAFIKRYLSKPEEPAEVRPELIVCAANLYSDGTCIPGVRHFDINMHGLIDKVGLRGKGNVPKQGFLTNLGRFVDREEGYQIAIANDQRKYRCGGDDKTLYSENLY